MSNTYFRFRQFTVRQEKCAMKVCTDACLFGAWLAKKVTNANRMLDIGAGTGLLSLMMAQNTQAIIDAVEIDPDASAQAVDNFNASPWAGRLTVINSSAQEYAASIPDEPLYDLIFSNPPFYSNDLKSPDPKRNIALHSDALTLEELAGCAGKMLRSDGFFALIVPSHRSAFAEKIAGENGFHLSAKSQVRQTEQHTFFRTMYLFCKAPQNRTSTSEIVIKDNNQKYSQEFSTMMEDYYLVPDNAVR
jgi:tRNA1Val (adenine37-N6)-methyltransferase